MDLYERLSGETEANRVLNEQARARKRKNSSGVDGGAAMEGKEMGRDGDTHAQRERSTRTGIGARTGTEIESGMGMWRGRNTEIRRE